MRKLRTAIAREEQIPPYIVFHDSTLRELARALPRDERSFLAVKGAGPSRWQKYGEKVIAITGQAPPALQVETPLPAEPAAMVRDEAIDDLWSLCASGATLGEICTRLRRTAADVASQHADGAHRGRRLDVARLIGQERVEAMRSAAAASGGDVVAARKRLPFPAALAEIRLALIGP